MTDPETPTPETKAAPAETPTRPKGLTIEVAGKTVPAILVEKRVDGTGGILVPKLNANPDCKTCFGTGYVRHGTLNPCKCVK